MQNRFFLLFTLTFLSCNKLVELPPNDSFLKKEDIKDNETLLQSYVYGLYTDLYDIFNNEISMTPDFANLGYLTGAFADEFMEVRAISSFYLRTRNAFYNSYYQNEPGETIPDFFTPMYNLVIRCNTVLDIFLYEDMVKYESEIAEVRAIRSILYFYLVQLYGKIPLLTSSDVDRNFKTPRSEVTAIYSFAVQDLEEAYKSVSASKLKVGGMYTQAAYTERINKDVITYYLSAFYMLNKDYNNAIKYAHSLKESYGFHSVYADKFKLNSSENLWILNPSIEGDDISSGRLNNPNAAFLHYKLWGFSQPFNVIPFALSNTLVSMMGPNDNRRIHYLDSVADNGETRYLPYKYRYPGHFGLIELNSPERFALIRLPAVYFNLMEAYLQNNQKAEAIAVFNEMGRVNYTDYVDVTDITLEDIVQERFKELFAENGDRWFTLKRTGLVDKVMSEYLPLKNNNAETWDSAKMLYLPIPFNTLQLNPNLH